MRVLVINPGATSTKLAAFDEETELFKRNIVHDEGEIASFERVSAQTQYRLDFILKTLEEEGMKPADFDAVCGRGGLFKHIPSGTYAVNRAVLDDALTAPEHASNLGVALSRMIADMAGIEAYFVDPVCTDEMNDVARVSGYSGFERESFFHALNHKSIARQAAKQLGKAYEEVNLIVVHMGGGVSTGAHEHGAVTDVFNVRDEGGFSMDRGGSLPTTALIELCFSGMEKREVKRLMSTRSGIFSYLGTRDFREVERLAFEDGDARARLVFDAFVYQTAKDIGAMAAVLRFDVDAIVLTGGMANSKRLCGGIEGYCGKIAPFIVLPGEEEMRSLAAGALRVLHGERAKIYPNG